MGKRQLLTAQSAGHLLMLLLHYNILVLGNGLHNYFIKSKQHCTGGIIKPILQMRNLRLQPKEHPDSERRSRVPTRAVGPQALYSFRYIQKPLKVMSLMGTPLTSCQ